MDLRETVSLANARSNAPDFTSFPSLPAGDSLLAPSVTRRLIEEFSKTPAADATPPLSFDDLTARELEVLKLIARGMSNAEIAAELIVSETTVKTHVTRVLLKLGVRDRVQAVVAAYEHGLVAPGSRPAA